MRRHLPFLIITAVLFAAVGAGLGKWYKSKRQAFQPASAAARRVEPGAEPAHARGPESALVTLEEFGDFQCPPCGRLYPVLKKIESDYGGRLRVVFRNYPLAETHKNALDAARAAEAAGLQGKFWEMHDRLYENQESWGKADDPRPLFAEQAGALGLNVERFRADLDSLPANSRIQLDHGRGDSLGVRGTPSLFLNGRPLSGVEDEQIRAAVEAAAAK